MNLLLDWYIMHRTDSWGRSFLNWFYRCIGLDPLYKKPPTNGSYGGYTEFLTPLDGLRVFICSGERLPFALPLSRLSDSVASIMLRGCRKETSARFIEKS